MPRIPDKYLDCVIYLYPSEDAAQQSMRVGGCGFLISLPSEMHENIEHIYVVTNAHVVEHLAHVVRLNTLNDNYDVLSVNDWIMHNNRHDVAIAYLGSTLQNYKVHTISSDMLLDEKTIETEGIGVGSDVFMVGRFSQHEGRQRNLPSARFGNIAMMPYEPIEQESRNHDQDSFLVEMRSIIGYSGSPVFVYDIYRGGVDAVSLTLGDPLLKLLGVDWGHLNLPQYTHSSMSGVVPAWTLKELLDSVEAYTPRADEDDRIKSQNGI